MNLSQELGFDSQITLTSGDQVRVSIFRYTAVDTAIDADTEIEVIEFLCDEDTPVTKGDSVTLNGKKYYADQCLNTGIGLKKVRLKCEKEQKSGISLGRL